LVTGSNETVRLGVDNAGQRQPGRAGFPFSAEENLQLDQANKVPIPSALANRTIIQ
jgi:hypothetical protein